MKITIHIDDADRLQATDKPWCAWIDDPEVDETGIGATPLEALQDLVSDLSHVGWTWGEG